MQYNMYTSINKSMCITYYIYGHHTGLHKNYNNKIILVVLVYYDSCNILIILTLKYNNKEHVEF
jgi:hypothetical protein